MTGEMHKSEVTKESYPCHFAVAEKYQGTVEPFDQYQGPYVHIPGKGRFWLSSDDGMLAYWYDESNHIASHPFVSDDEDALAFFTHMIEGNFRRLDDEGRPIDDC